MARAMNKIRSAKYQIGQVVRHRLFPFRGVVFDIDPIFNNTEEWYQSIPAEVLFQAAHWDCGQGGVAVVSDHANATREEAHARR